MQKPLWLEQDPERLIQAMSAGGFHAFEIDQFTGYISELEEQIVEPREAYNCRGCDELKPVNEIQVCSECGGFFCSDCHDTDDHPCEGL